MLFGLPDDGQNRAWAVTGNQKKKYQFSSNHQKHERACYNVFFLVLGLFPTNINIYKDCHKSYENRNEWIELWADKCGLVF